MQPNPAAAQPSAPSPSPEDITKAKKKKIKNRIVFGGVLLLTAACAITLNASKIAASLGHSKTRKAISRIPFEFIKAPITAAQSWLIQKLGLQNAHFKFGIQNIAGSLFDFVGKRHKPKS